VSPFAVNIRLDRPHLSCGAGARYDTPVGPIRLDVGYRIPGMQYPSGATFERPPEPLLGMPIAIAFGIGEAF
jgi:outer membrane protein insertion porin family/translocation and assembly module TamA